MIYELINPSDPYTFIADCYETAALTVMCLGTVFGAKPQEGEKAVPITMFCDPDEWYTSTFGRTIDEGIKDKKQELINSLDSMRYGDFAKRAEYEAAMAMITDEGKRREYDAEWSDKRSSFNSIDTYARQLAKVFLRGE